MREERVMDALIQGICGLGKGEAIGNRSTAGTPDKSLLFTLADFFILCLFVCLRRSEQRGFLEKFNFVPSLAERDTLFRRKLHAIGKIQKVFEKIHS